jgi:OFA family oxalate/formate antiporter-like MFS transporter
VGILSLFNAFGRIFWGKVSDYIDRPRAMMLMFLMQGLTCMLLLNVSSPAAVFLVSALVGLNFGGNFALFPAATADYFGTKYLGANYGWIFTAYGVAGIIGPVAGGILYDITKQYILAFLFAGILCFVAAGTAVVTWGLARAEQPGQTNRPIVSPSS